MFRKRVLTVSAVVAAALSMSGCAPAVRTQQIDINSSMEGSKIAVYDKNNNKVFESGASAAANLRIGDKNSGGVYLVEITKEGY
jgi:outer membrane murein-binding lipoprotein Lpp